MEDSDTLYLAVNELRELINGVREDDLPLVIRTVVNCRPFARLSSKKGHLGLVPFIAKRLCRDGECLSYGLLQQLLRFIAGCGVFQEVQETAGRAAAHIWQHAAASDDLEAEGDTYAGLRIFCRTLDLFAAVFIPLLDQGSGANLHVKEGAAVCLAAVSPHISAAFRGLSRRFGLRSMAEGGGEGGTGGKGKGKATGGSGTEEKTSAASATAETKTEGADGTETGETDQTQTAVSRSSSHPPSSLTVRLLFLSFLRQTATGRTNETGDTGTGGGSSGTGTGKLEAGSAALDAMKAFVENLIAAVKWNYTLHSHLLRVAPFLPPLTGLCVHHLRQPPRLPAGVSVVDVPSEVVPDGPLSPADMSRLQGLPRPVLLSADLATVCAAVLGHVARVLRALAGSVSMSRSPSPSHTLGLASEDPTGMGGCTTVTSGGVTVSRTGGTSGKSTGAESSQLSGGKQTRTATDTLLSTPLAGTGDPFAFAGVALCEVKKDVLEALDGFPLLRLLRGNSKLQAAVKYAQCAWERLPVSDCVPPPGRRLSLRDEGSAYLKFLCTQRSNMKTGSTLYRHTARSTSRRSADRSHSRSRSRSPRDRLRSTRSTGRDSQDSSKSPRRSKRRDSLASIGVSTESHRGDRGRRKGRDRRDAATSAADSRSSRSRSSRDSRRSGGEDRRRGSRSDSRRRGSTVGTSGVSRESRATETATDSMTRTRDSQTISTAPTSAHAHIQASTLTTDSATDALHTATASASVGTSSGVMTSTERRRSDASTSYDGYRRPSQDRGVGGSDWRGGEDRGVGDGRTGRRPVEGSTMTTDNDGTVLPGSLTPRGSSSATATGTGTDTMDGRGEAGRRESSSQSEIGGRQRRESTSQCEDSRSRGDGGSQHEGDRGYRRDSASQHEGGGMRDGATTPAGGETGSLKEGRKKLETEKQTAGRERGDLEVM
uniref:Uncharacterized protein n=1 Tax=Chromera velia CCMP2878 TaxID=1169474 RepID=A0A0G4HB95_9ALVE|eukprot:Cvel_25904.t1-p1 / transcript=Cvel_25904.t1 / gene=Cvel_25904 / organism=Chromera_velia_CCMP2878 / gene_product=hypothetical protein / transcript_product=hypothetical protein / location=Cvel_scaffold2993:6424-12123(+) / protein_length=938 / sequence_SO=supercontig / SO=protein_coding / is_pseudo=false